MDDRLKAHRTRRVRLFSAIILAGTALAAHPAMAQDDGEVEKTRREVTTASPAEIIVTAQRRAESVQRTSVAISVISGSELNEEARQTVAEALANEPGVQVQGTPQGGQVFIRGVGANGDSNFIDSAVALMLDGVYSGRSEALGGGLYDVERMEILRGPQGTLYGRNATGGVINVLTKKPTNEFEAAVNGRIGNYGLMHWDGAINLPVTDDLAVRVAGVREFREGYFSNGARESNVTGARAKVKWSSGDAISIVGTVDWYKSKGYGNTTVPTPGSTRTQEPDVLTSRWDVDSLHPPEYRNTRFVNASLELNADLGFANLTVIPAYTASRRYVYTNLISGIEINPITGDPSELMGDTTKEKQYSGEIRLSSQPESPIVWVAGLYGLRSVNENIITEATSLANGYFSSLESGPTTSYAAFAQVTVPVTERLRLIGGLRYTKDRKERSYGFESLPVTGYPIFSVGPDSLVDGYNALTYRAGFEYDAGPQSLLYGSVATGYKAGGFGTTTFPPVPYNPEKLMAFEIGSKNRFFDNRLTLNMAAYYYRYKNYQTQYAVFGGTLAQTNLLISYMQQEGYSDAQIDDYIATYTAEYLNEPDSPSFTIEQFTQYVANADTGRNFGVELDSRFQLTPRDEIGIQYSYTNARYGDFDTTVAPSLASISGARVANAPLHSGMVSYQHRFDLFSGELSARAEMRLSGGYWTTVGDRMFDGAYQKSFHVSNAFLTYTSGDKRFTGTLWVKNIEGKAQVTYIFPQNRQLISDPRTYGVNLSAKF